MAKKIPVKKILVADDSEDTRELLKFTFEHAGYETIIVENGKELLEKVKEIVPDLIVLDLMMPGLNGYSVLLELKSHLETKNIPVIISTGKSELKGLPVFENTFRISGFIEKPYQPDEILKLVKKILKY